MKKILIFIVGILGIGLSFCSADGIYHNSDLGLISIIANGETVYTLQDKNLGATCTDVSDSCSYGNFFQWGNNFPFSYQSQSSSNCSFNSSYGPGNYFNSNGVFCINNNGLSYPNLWGAITNTDSALQGPCPDGFHVPYSWSGFISSLSSFFTIDQNFFNTYLFFPYRSMLGGYGGFESNNISCYQNAFYEPLYAGNGYNIYLLQLSSFFQIWGINVNVGCHLRCFKNELVDPDYTRTVVYGDEILPPPSPKFKVNYGNTSYEYTLEDNLEIRLNSPVLKDGDNYSYDGLTGINLFYNGGSQFYNKSELYLFTPSWYSSNIFNPICL